MLTNDLHLTEARLSELLSELHEVSRQLTYCAENQIQPLCQRGSAAWTGETAEAFWGKVGHLASDVEASATQVEQLAQRVKEADAVVHASQR